MYTGEISLQPNYIFPPGNDRNSSSNVLAEYRLLNKMDDSDYLSLKQQIF